MMVCQVCGNAAQSTDGFCTSCGALLEWSGQAVHSPQAPVARQPVAEAGRPPPERVVEEPVYTGPYCSACGVRNAIGRTFCRSCGERLTAEVAVQEARKGWWRRLMDRLSGRRSRSAGERPRGFVNHNHVPAAPGTGPGGSPGPGGNSGQGWGSAPSWNSGAAYRQRRFRPPRRLALSRFGPLLIVAALLGIGLGPARGWITTHLFGLESKLVSYFDQHYDPVVPTGATASSAAPGHDPLRAVDGNTSTYWLTGGTSGLHAKLTVTFATPENIAAIGLWGGEPGGAYTSQARPETVKISAPGQPAALVTFGDTSNFQHQTVNLHGVTAITVTIKKVYPGQQGQAVAIREIEFFTKK